MYWRELPEPDQKLAFAHAEEILVAFPTPADAEKEMTPEEFKGYYKAAKLNYDSGLDIPPSISERARAGLLGAHIIAARDESVYLEDSDFLYVLDLMIKDDQ